MPIHLTYAIMTHNELAEFRWLMDVLKPLQNAQTEIVVLDDFSDQPMIDFIKSQNVRFEQRALNKNFSAQRNYLKNLCRGDFIFCLDADEIPSPQLLQLLPRVMDIMKHENLDACMMPRLNILLEGERPVDARTLTLSNADLENQKSDYQMRLIRNIPAIKWTNHVHERLLGVTRAGRFPNDVRYALLHCKTQTRYEKQNRFYRSITLRYVDKWRKSLAKRLGLIKQSALTDLTPFLSNESEPTLRTQAR